MCVPVLILRCILMNILAIGDVVGSVGCEFLREKLPSFKKLKNIDVVIANGENSSDGNGITRASARYLFDSGVDVITTGNHAFRRREDYELFDENPFVVRPANYPDGTTPGKGYCIVDKGRFRMAVLNLMGTVFLEPLDCPFKTADRILKEIANEGIKTVILDFHAEATGEKRALGFYLDGRISGLYGTHTHVLTADACILPKGTGYITDAGMTGVIDSVLGVKSEIIIKRYMERLPQRFDLEKGPCKLNGVIFEVNQNTGMCNSCEGIEII